MRELKPPPLPWKRGTDGLIFDADNEYVTDTCGTSLPEGEDNQKLIVLACNAHVELLAACKNALASLLITSLPRLDNSTATDAEIIAVVVKSLRTVIQKAESGDTEKT